MRIHTLSPPHTYILIEKDADDDVDTDDDDHPRILESPPSNQSPPGRPAGTALVDAGNLKFQFIIPRDDERRATSERTRASS
jgi:hypothetical protein|tara:strand:+ start:1107 stop:1352 length:246 start_codon:yes stop_codon:yes gene_type:complete